MAMTGQSARGADERSVIRHCPRERRVTPEAKARYARKSNLDFNFPVL
jgi:hypothetical protein